MGDVGAEQIVKAPRALPLLGHALVMLRDPLGFLSSLPGSGEVVEIRLGPMPMLVVCDPELTRQILLDDSTFDKGGPLIEKLRELMGDGLGVCPHAAHRRQRRMVQPAFHPARLPGYARTMTEQISAVTGDWADGQTISPLPQMMTLSSRVTIATLFGTALPAGTMTEVVQDVVTIIDRIYLRMLMGPLNALPTPGNRRYHRASARLRRVIERLVADSHTDRVDRDDLLSILTTVHDETGDRLSDAEVIDQILTILIAGVESTATLLTWAMHLLAQHPEIQRRLRAEVAAEVDAVTGPTYADLHRLELTGNIITETLRLYPPGWITTRTTTADTRLGGRRIPAGTSILISPYLIHHRADLHPGPDRFDPDRWGGAPPARNALIPFGGGARKCVGDVYAITEATLALAAIAARWTLQPVPGHEARPHPRVALTPHRLQLRLSADEHRRDG